MLEAALEQLLLRFLDPYVDGISRDKLHLGVFRGSLELTDLLVKPDLPALLGLEGFRVRSGSIQLLKLSVPWSRIYTGKVRAVVRAVHLEVEQIGDASTPDSELIAEVRGAKQRAIELRMAQLRSLLEHQREQFAEALEAAGGSGAGSAAGYTVKLLRKVLNNIQIDLSDVRVSFVSKLRGFACGLELPVLSVVSTDQTFRERPDTEEVLVSGLSLYKLLHLRGLSVLMSAAGKSSLEDAEYVLSPISASLQLAHVPSDQILRLKLEVATEEIADFTLARSQIKHLRSVQAAARSEAQRLHALLVAPEEEMAILADPAASTAMYAQLYERQLLHKWQLAARKDAPLSSTEARRLQAFEDALSVRLLARQRWRVHNKVEALRDEHERIKKAVEVARSGAGAKPGAGLLSRMAGYATYMGSPDGALHATQSGSTIAWLSLEDRDQVRDQLLRDSIDEAKVEAVDLPQRLKLEFVVGKVSLDLVDDRWPEGVRRQLLSLALQDANCTVDVHLETNHRGQDSVEWKVECRLSAFRALHTARVTFRFCPQNIESGQPPLDGAGAARFVVERKSEPTQNLMRLRFDFAPLEIHVLPSVVHQLLDFLESPGNGEIASPRVRQHLEDVVQDVVQNMSKQLLDGADPAAKMEPEGGSTCEQIPHRLDLDIRLASPTVHVPVAGLGMATFSLGQLRLHMPSPCVCQNITLVLDLTDTALCATSTTGERFSMIQPVTVNHIIRYQSSVHEASVDMQVAVGDMALALAPQSLHILLLTPAAMASIMSPPAQPAPCNGIGGGTAGRLDGGVSSAPEALQAAPAAACSHGSHGGYPASGAGAQQAGVVTNGSCHSSLAAATGHSAKGIGSPATSAKQGTGAVDAAPLEPRPRQFRFNLTIQLRSLEVTLFADSIAPALRLRMWAFVPGFRTYRQSSPPMFSLDVEDGAIEADILNPRAGVWEPLVERFTLGFQIVRKPEGDGVFTTHLIVGGHEPLLVNLTPTAIRQVGWIAGLFTESFARARPVDARASSGQAAAGNPSASEMKYRVVNLCDYPIELEFKSRHRSGLMAKIEPTGSLWEPLDDWILPSFAHAVVARVKDGQPSEVMPLERAGAVIVPGSDAVAELLTPEPGHRLLLLATRLRVHNQTDVTLLLRFHDAFQREVLMVDIPQTTACDAALLGHALPQDSVPSPFGGASSQELTEVANVVLLSPNAVCAVPALALARGKGPVGGSARMWMSVKPVGMHVDFCRTVETGAGVDLRTLTCHEDMADSTNTNGASSAARKARAAAGHAGEVHLLCESQSYVAPHSSRLTLTTVVLRPTLSILNALPIGNLTVGFAQWIIGRSPAASWIEVSVPKFKRINLYNFPGAPCQGIGIRACLEDGAPWSSSVVLGPESFELPNGSQEIPLRQCAGGAAAGVVVEAFGLNEVRFSCQSWFVDRSGLTKPLALELLSDQRPLPSRNGVTLLPASCYDEDSCSLVLRSVCSSFAVRPLFMPSSWGVMVWRTPCGPFVFCLQTDDVASKDVFGARCQVTTLRPRLVLTNSSDTDIELQMSHTKILRLAAGQSMESHWHVGVGDESAPTLGLRFRPIRATPGHWSGLVLCGDVAAGSTPFAMHTVHAGAGQGSDSLPARGQVPASNDAPEGQGLATVHGGAQQPQPPPPPPAEPAPPPQRAQQPAPAAGSPEVWSVDIAPGCGALAVAFRPGSDCVAVNRTTRGQTSMRVRPLGGEHGTAVDVPPGQEVPYGWEQPFHRDKGRAVDVFLGRTVLRIPNVQRTMRRTVRHLSVTISVARAGAKTLLLMEDADGVAPVDHEAGSSGGAAWLERIEVRLSHLGVSLVQELPKAQELLFFHFDLVRLEWRQNDNGMQELRLAVSELQADCQLPGRVDARNSDRRRQATLGLLRRERPAVICANCADGERSFLSLFVQRAQTSSGDLLLPHVELSLDAMDFTADDGWLNPLVAFMAQARGSRNAVGLPLEQLVRNAGLPIVEDYTVPVLPSVVQIDSMSISAITLTIWCMLQLKSAHFLPAYMRAALRVLSLSGQFTLDGPTLTLPARRLPPHRGSLHDFALGIADEYMMNLLRNVGTLLGKSSVLNLPRVPLNIGSTTVSYLSDSIGLAAGEAASLLGRLTFDADYVAQQQRIRSSKRIRGIGDGVLEASKSLAHGVESFLDVVKKPVEGAQRSGLGGFVAGVGKGVSSALVKPISQIGHAISDVGTGVAAQVAMDSPSLRRRRARARQRQPRMLFGPSGVLRPWCELEAEVLRQLPASLTAGIEEVVPLTQQGTHRTVLLLSARRLVVAELGMPGWPSSPTPSCSSTAPPLTHRRTNSGGLNGGGGSGTCLSNNNLTGAGGTRSTGGRQKGLYQAMDETAGKLKSQAWKPINTLVHGVQDMERQLLGRVDSDPVDALDNRLSQRVRDFDFVNLGAVQTDDTGFVLQLVDRVGGTMDLPLFASPLGDLARAALADGCRSALASTEGLASWEALREALSVQFREQQAGSSTGARCGNLAFGGGAGERVLEVLEVERKLPGSAEWRTPFLPIDGELVWRWVDATGCRHPHLVSGLQRNEVAARRTPPCRLDSLFRSTSEWQVHVHSDTDEQGWQYGLAWNSSTWDVKPGILDGLRRRRWRRIFT